MDPSVPILIASALSSLLMLFSLGANDVANSIALPLNAKALTSTQALILASICNVLGATFAGSHVTQTLSHSVAPALSSNPSSVDTGLAFVCATIAAGATVFAGTLIGLPLSSTHAIVGGVAGGGLLIGGWTGINWKIASRIAIAWLISPLLGGIGGALLAWGVRKMESRRMLWGRMALGGAVGAVVGGGLGGGIGKPFGEAWIACITGAILGAIVGVLVVALTGRRDLPEGTGLLSGQQELLENAGGEWKVLLRIVVVGVAFAHGSNDVANGVGPFVAVLRYYNGGQGVGKWAMLGVLCVGGMGIAFGLSTFGERVVKTIGGNDEGGLTGRKWSFGMGFAAEFAAMLCVLGASRGGLPISTSHVIVGAVVGVSIQGMLGVKATGNEGVRWAVLGKVLIAGALTPVLSATASMALLWVTKGLLT